MKQSRFFAVVLFVVSSLLIYGCGKDTETKTNTVYVDKKEVKLWWSSVTQPNNPMALCGMDYCRGAEMSVSVVVTNDTDQAVNFSFSHDLHQGGALMVSNGDVVDDNNNAVLPKGGVPGGGSGGGGGGGLTPYYILPGEAVIVWYGEYTSDILAGDTAYLDFQLQLEDGATMNLRKELVFGNRPSDLVTEEVFLNNELWLGISEWNAPYNMNDELYKYVFCSGDGCGLREVTAEQSMFWTGEYIRHPNDDFDKAVDHYLFFDDGSSDVAWGFDYNIYGGVEYDPSSYDGVAASFIGNTIYMMGTEYTISDVEVLGYFKDGVLNYQLDSITLFYFYFHWVYDWEHNVYYEAMDPISIKMQNGMEIRINGVSMDGTVVYLNQYGSQLWGLSMYWTPDDEIYLNDGNGTLYRCSLGVPLPPPFNYDQSCSVKDPLNTSGNTSKIMVSEMLDAAEYDTISAETQGAYNGVFEFQDAMGRKIEIPVNYTSFDGIRLGDDRSVSDCDGRMLLDGEMCNAPDYSGLEGVSFPLSSWWGGLYVLQIANIKDIGGGFLKIDFKDLTLGKTIEDIVVEKDVLTKLDYCPEENLCAGFDILITSDGSVQVQNNLANPIFTSNGAEIMLSPFGNITVYENYWIWDEGIDDWVNTSINLSFQYNAVDDELQAVQPQTDSGITWYSFSKYIKEIRVATSAYGSELMWDSDAKDYAEVLYPPYTPYLEVSVQVSGN